VNFLPPLSLFTPIFKGRKEGRQWKKGMRGKKERKELTLFLYRPVVMVPDPGLSKNLTKEATQVLSSLEEFDPAAWGLPPYDSSTT
jgi:hypothetical protein